MSSRPLENDYYFETGAATVFIFKFCCENKKMQLLFDLHLIRKQEKKEQL